MHANWNQILSHLLCSDAPLIFTILSFSVTLTLADGQRSVQSKTCVLQFLAHLWTDHDEIWCDIETIQKLKSDVILKQSKSQPDINVEWDLNNEGK